MPLGILICFGYLTYIASIVSSSKVGMKKFNKYAVSDKRLESHEYATESWSSVMCAASCQQRDSCNSVSFKESTGSCKGYSLRPDDASASLVVETGTQMFYKERQCNGWSYRGYCYTLGDDLMAWENSKEYCEENGQKLVEIGDEDENNFIQDMLIAKRQCTGWSYRGYCYTLGDDLMTWENSKEYCEENGQKLVEIGDEDENNFIQDMLIANGNVTTVLTGGNDLQQEGTFVWNDGDTMAYTQFAMAEPNDGDTHNCIKIKVSSGGYWYDAKCSREYFPICELHV